VLKNAAFSRAGQSPYGSASAVTLSFGLVMLVLAALI
jgi:hypothetical protein